MTRDMNSVKSEFLTDRFVIVCSSHATDYLFVASLSPFFKNVSKKVCKIRILLPEYADPYSPGQIEQRAC